MRCILATLFVCLLATSVNASILDTYTRVSPSGVLNTIEDSDAEVIIKNGANPLRFETGDFIDVYGNMSTITSSDGFFFNTFLNSATAGGAGYNLLFYGRLTVTVSNITAGADTILGTADDRADFSFSGPVGFREAASPFVFTGATAVSTADALWAASGPTIAAAGIADGNDFYTALNAPLYFAGIPTSGVAVNANFGLSLTSGGIFGLQADAALDVNGVPQTFVGSTQTFFIAGAVIGDDAFDLRTNTDISYVGLVPEPMTLFVFGGLFGIAALRRRRSMIG